MPAPNARSPLTAAALPEVFADHRIRPVSHYSQALLSALRKAAKGELPATPPARTFRPLVRSGRVESRAQH